MPVGAPLTAVPEVNVFGDKRDPEAEAAEAERILNTPDGTPQEDEEPEDEPLSELDQALAEVNADFISEEDELRKEFQEQLENIFNGLQGIEQIARKNDRSSFANDIVSAMKLINHLKKRCDRENPFLLKGKKS